MTALRGGVLGWPGGLAAIVAAGALGACGDNLPAPDAAFTAVSGTRLSLQKYRFDDGTEQAVNNEFYDTALHTRCTPQAWADGTVPCVPVADDAVYVDAGCTTLVGITRTIAMPSYFIVHASLPTGNDVVAHVFRAGSPASPITASWRLFGDQCIGPSSVAPGPVMFFGVGDEIAAGDLVAFHDDEIGTGRFGLQIRGSDDGLRVTTGVRDRDLDTACVATVEADGSVTCEPNQAPAARVFTDPACSTPAIDLDPGAPLPMIVQLDEPSGCASYHRLGARLSPPFFSRVSGPCGAFSTNRPVFAIGAPLDLPVLGRTLEVVPGHRLQRVVLDADGSRFFDDRLFDPALGADCQVRTLRSALRCVPVATLSSTPLFAAGCTAQTAVVDVPPSCERFAFATFGRPFQIREIGDAISTVVYHFDGGGVCQSFAGSPGNALHSLGPALDLSAFLGAIYYGERSP